MKFLKDLPWIISYLAAWVVATVLIWTIMESFILITIDELQSSRQPDLIVLFAVIGVMIAWGLAVLSLFSLATRYILQVMVKQLEGGH